jgi:precorrin isomerase
VSKLTQTLKFIHSADWVITPGVGAFLLVMTTLMAAAMITGSNRQEVTMQAATCAVAEAVRDDSRVRMNVTCVKEGITQTAQVQDSAQVVLMINRKLTHITCDVTRAGVAINCVAVTQN